MPFLDLASHRLHYRMDCTSETAPWLVFCNSLGTDLHMWDAQIDELSRHFRVLRYDRRGHGKSSTPPGPYTLADLGGDVVALLDGLGIDRADFCGLSLGGLTGQWLGIHAPDRLNRLVVCATAQRIGTAEGWRDRIRAVQADGLAELTGAAAERWFSPGFRNAHPEVVGEILGVFTNTAPKGYCGCCAALADADLRAEIARIPVPVLAISGSDDTVCPPSDMEAIVRKIPERSHVSLPGRHLVNVESARDFNECLISFLCRLGPSPGAARAPTT